MYKQNCHRTFFASNVSFLMAGTLIILITSLFINAGASMKISKNDMEPNQIVMNSVISAASSGLLICMMTQWTNVLGDGSQVQDR
jgi:hypothetical protein